MGGVVAPSVKITLLARMITRYEEWRFKLGANKWMSDKGNDEFEYDLTYVIQNATDLILLAYPMRLLNSRP